MDNVDLESRRLLTTFRRVTAAMRLALLGVFCCTCGSALALPILDDTMGPERITGWENSKGTFQFDFSNFLAGPHTTVSYSTATDTYAFEGSTRSPGGGPSADVTASAVVADNGTVSGDLMSGFLNVFATADDVARGIVNGQLLMSGTAIEAAAMNNDNSTAILFELNVLHSSLSMFGSFVTLIDNTSARWGGASPYMPWGRDWTATTGFTDWDVVQTTLTVPEPGTLALLTLGLFGLRLGTRRAAS